MIKSKTRPVAGRIAYCVLLVSAMASLPVPALARSQPAAGENLASLNLALKTDPLNARLNYLAALAYETSSVIGTERRDVAKSGYVMSLKGDPTFWPAYVQLGQMAMEERDGALAQRYFINAALLQPQESVIFYGLARAAYCTGDLGLAKVAYARAASLMAPTTADQLATGAAIESKGGNAAFAQKLIAQMTPDANVPPMVAQAMSTPFPAARPDASAAPPAPQSTAPVLSQKMGMVDVIILRRDELAYSTSGINLLEALTLQFGGSLINSHWASSRDRISGSLSSSTQDISRDLTATLPSVTYSLNIANARDGWSSVQAQQALLIYDGETSKVSVGSSLTYATDGELSSSIATKDDGLSLQMKPQFLGDGLVKLTVSAILEDFVPGAGAGSFRQAVQTEKSSTDVVAELRFGDTILIASGENAMHSRAGNKTPLVGDVPVLGGLFKTRGKSRMLTSILILLTLRPRGSEQLPQAGELERREFEEMKDRLLDQLEPAHKISVQRFIPDLRTMSYQIENPARAGDRDYLARAGALSSR
jgi:hypothetical protein